MPKQKVDHEALQKEGIWISDEFYPFTVLWRKLRQAREERRESLEEAASTLGITASALSRLERSQTTPSSDVLGRVVTYLFGETPLTFGTQGRKPQENTRVDTVSRLRHALMTDAALTNAQRSRLTQLISLLYEEFVSKAQEGAAGAHPIDERE